MESSSTNHIQAFDCLRFMAIVVAVLAFLAIVFPSNGIKIGKTTLRFPTVHSVLAKNRKQKVQRSEELQQQTLPSMTDAEKSQLASLNSQLFGGEGRIWLPKDDNAFFDSFFDKACKARSEKRTVRVLHYGDSQIESDRITAQLRSRLQELYGGGGPGLIPLMQPIPSFSVNQKTKGSLVGQSTYGRGNFVRANGNYGPMLRSWRMMGSAQLSVTASKNRASDERVKHFSKVSVLFNNRPGPLSVVLTDNRTNSIIRMRQIGGGVQTLDFKLDSITNSLTLSLDGTADIYGVMLDDDCGVAVDNISMRGVSGQQFTMVDSAQLAEAYRLMDVGMIIMQFGGNSVPYLTDRKAIDIYCSKIGRQIDFLHNLSLHTPILFIGPSDMSTKINGQLATYPILPEVVDRLRETALAHGAAFWSLYDAMGGNGSMVEWVSGGLAEHDYLHFNVKGAAVMGDRLADIFQQLNELYTLRKGTKR
jgi:lysophospholipase L1-like esterase